MQVGRAFAPHHLISGGAFRAYRDTAASPLGTKFNERRDGQVKGEHDERTGSNPVHQGHVETLCGSKVANRDLSERPQRDDQYENHRYQGETNTASRAMQPNGNG